ncbi:hypothetical protein [Nocardioides sp. 1609]|uniref:hypothetical protein n=1 Tax=Nocardioides sp. 1609 TaxID=2508327 RepID=UPI00107033BD|nr:hypothetical protein [Nocardioides sp. 1609]
MTREKSRDGEVTLRASSFETLAADHPLAFPVPYGQMVSPSTVFEGVWHYLQYVFDFHNPADFVPIPAGVLTDDDRRTLERYLRCSRGLADGQFLRHPLKLEVSFGGGREGTEVVGQDFPHAENIRGFSVLFRQLNENGEGASFHRAQTILRQAAQRADDDHTDLRIERITEWARAVGRLRAFQLHVLVGQRLVREGRYRHEGPFPGEEMSPAFLISRYNYGEDIHWGKHRDEVDALSHDPFMASWTRMLFFDAVAGLAHTFLGFSLLVRRSLEG